MSDLDDIKVSIEQRVTSQVVAVLNEIDSLLQNLVEKREIGTIDLRSLPLSPADYDALKQLLAEGEVTATLQAMGPTTVQETRIPGVWWITHMNQDEEKIAEYIEVTRVPELLKTTKEDLMEAPDGIRHLIDDFLNHDK